MPHSYRLDDFRRLFGTSDAAAFIGTEVRVGGIGDDAEVLPEIFGSVRAYFEAVSGGRFDLQVSSTALTLLALYKGVGRGKGVRTKGRSSRP